MKRKRVVTNQPTKKDDGIKTLIICVVWFVIICSVVFYCGSNPDGLPIPQVNIKIVR